MGTSTSHATQQNTLAASKDVRRQLSCNCLDVTKTIKKNSDGKLQILTCHFNFCPFWAINSEVSSPIQVKLNRWILITAPSLDPTNWTTSNLPCCLTKDGHVNWASPTAPLNLSQRADSHRPQCHSGDLMFLLAVSKDRGLSPLQVSFFCRGLCVGKIGKMLGILMHVNLSSKQIRRAWCPRTRDPLPLHSPFLERPPKSSWDPLKGSQWSQSMWPRLWGHVVRCAHHGVRPTFQFSQLFRHLWRGAFANPFSSIWIYLHVCDVYTTCTYII